MELTIEHNATTWNFLNGSKARTNILYGGAGSGKSWSIAQYIVLILMMDMVDVRILVVRKTRPALKKSAWLLITDLLKKYNIAHKKNLSDMTTSFNGNEMYFTSLDDPEKIKSFEKINYVWAEEATELNHSDYMQLGLRCRGANKKGHNQLYFSFNPIDEMSFFKDLTLNPPEGTAINFSTLEDNEIYLRTDEGRTYATTLNQLESQDETYYKIYKKGLWATPTNIIYTHWDVVKAMPDRFDDVYWGLDFGYSSNPAALVEVRTCGISEVYEREHIYQTGLTNPQLIERLEGIVTNKNQMIIADCADPKSIQEIRNAGFNIFPCVKGKDSVKYGINAVRSVMTHICSNSQNLIDEKKSYKWKVDKDDNVKDEPVKLFDHLMDAERYVMMKLKGKVKIGFIGVNSIKDDDDKDKGILQQRYHIDEPEEAPVAVGVTTEDIDNDEGWEIRE